MATYKRRGYKKPKVKEVIDPINDNIEGYVEGESTTEELFDSLDNSANKVEEFIEKNQKYISGILTAVVICVLGYFLFNKFIAAPKEVKATNEIYSAHTQLENAVNAEFKQDSIYNLALNGADGKLGYKQIAEKYGSTKAGDLAKYAAGMALLNNNKRKEAIEYLQDFSSDNIILQPLALGGIGDAFADLNQFDNAYEYYMKAVNHNKNDFTTPKFLYKAGIAALESGNKEQAKKHFQAILDDYKSSSYVKYAEGFIGMVQ